jgi:hypothetical protein
MLIYPTLHFRYLPQGQGLRYYYILLKQDVSYIVQVWITLFDKGKPGKSRGRKAMGLQLDFPVMTAKPPK